MRPEKKAVEVELSAEEKEIIEILKANETAMALNSLKLSPCGSVKNGILR